MLCIILLLHFSDHENMVDGKLSTYGTAYFDEKERVGVIQVDLVKSANIYRVYIYGSPLNGARLYVEDTYCGKCWENNECMIPCLAKGKKILVEKDLPLNHRGTTLRINEIGAYGAPILGNGLTSGGLIGIVVGVICLLSIILFVAYWARIKVRSRQFYSELFAKYAAASSEGEKFGQFQIQQQHPNEMLECTVQFFQEVEASGTSKTVNFEIEEENFETNLNKSDRKIIVKFKEVGVTEHSEELETPSNQGRVDVVIDHSLRLTAEERLPLPTVPEMLILPPLPYRASNEIRNQSNSDIARLEGVIANPAAFSVDETNMSDTSSSNFRFTML